MVTGKARLGSYEHRLECVSPSLVGNLEDGSCLGRSLAPTGHAVATLAGHSVRGGASSQPGCVPGLVTATHPLASHSPSRTAQLSLQRVHGRGSPVLGCVAPARVGGLPPRDQLSSGNPLRLRGLCAVAGLVLSTWSQPFRPKNWTGDEGCPHRSMASSAGGSSARSPRPGSLLT